ncbi:MAG: CHAD domain-containing protein [Oscillatoriales cyanobacterium RM2_1_1]|nr:CHAD domain-containing protein [Oscillatoriales cyanobacterium SM2_3_0]NJO47942.1 CHAD domain-containing protein [Oscillatoriales cyanobacterium RM2_1_1]
MTTKTLHKTKTLGDWAILGIHNHLKKILKHEPEVLKDENPEELHQMRVGMRRLRSAIKGFSPVLNLPKSIQDRQIGKVGRCLGELRDLDVLLEALRDRYFSQLSTEEQEILDRALLRLSKRRQKAVRRVQKTLVSNRYQHLIQDLEKWLKTPSYNRLERLPIEEVLPDLLLPQISQLFLHPGWQVGTQDFSQDFNPDFNPDAIPLNAPAIAQATVCPEVIQPEEVQPILIDAIPVEFRPEVNGSDSCQMARVSPESVEALLQVEGESLHDLRKEVKRMRYQMSLFTDFYGAEYGAFLEEIKAIQECLGEIQDSEVLEQVMEETLKSDLAAILPGFANLLAEARCESWQRWRSLQSQYLKLETRQAFRRTVLSPVVR